MEKSFLDLQYLLSLETSCKVWYYNLGSQQARGKTLLTEIPSQRRVTSVCIETAGLSQSYFKLLNCNLCVPTAEGTDYSPDIS